MKKDIKYIDLNWSPEEIRKFIEHENNWILALDKDMDVNKITSLFEKHINSPFCSYEIIAEIAEHENTPIKILENIAQNLKSNKQVMSALATNINLSLKMLQELSKNKDQDIKNHAIQNMKNRLTKLKK